MQVIINIGGRWKGDRKAHKLLELHAERIRVTMNRLAKAFKLSGERFHWMYAACRKRNQA